MARTAVLCVNFAAALHFNAMFRQKKYSLVLLVYWISEFDFGISFYLCLWPENRPRRWQSRLPQKVYSVRLSVIANVCAYTSACMIEIFFFYALAGDFGQWKVYNHIYAWIDKTMWQDGSTLFIWSLHIQTLNNLSSYVAPCFNGMNLTQKLFLSPWKFYF